MSGKGTLIVAAFAAMAYFQLDNIVFTIGFLGTARGLWTYTDSDLYMTWLTAKVQAMPVVEPTSIPEISIENFSREAMMKLSNNMADPIVIRGALKDSEAVQKWNLDFFEESYPQEKFVVREMEGLLVRMQERTFEDFVTMRNKGRNVSIVASSTVFQRNPVLKKQMESTVEPALVGPSGELIVANQFFITPGGRSWYHCAVGNNVFRQVTGQKRWTVIDPKKYNLHMCPIPVITGTSVSPCLESLSEDAREEWITHIPRSTALLNPGDILVNAGWWWHDVQSIGDVNTPIVSVAGRIKNMKSTFMNSPVLTVNALLTKLLSKNAFHQVDFEVALQEEIVTSWTRSCVAHGRTDCITPP